MITDPAEAFLSGVLKIKEVQAPIKKAGVAIKVSMPNMAKILALSENGGSLVFSLAFEGPYTPAEREFFLYNASETYNLSGAHFFVGAVRYKSDILYCFERC